MLPFVLPGARLVVEPASEADVDVGDVVVFAQDGAWVVHRVVAVEDGHVVTRGDAHRAPDIARAGRRIVARVRGLALGDRAWPVPAPVARGIGGVIVRSGPHVVEGMVPVVRAANALRYRVRRALGAATWSVTVVGEHELNPRTVDAYFRDRGIHRGSGASGASATSLRLAIHETQIVGSVCTTRHDDVALVFDLYVRPDARGRGVGVTLLRALRERTPRAVHEAEIRIDNTPSKACFARAGFTRIARADPERWRADPL